ncbi:hypothetical protein TNCV_4952461 [Trichonephila clavipes]|nr:hypothetical protein TNCV_4952461 [Trichonephila clavipes]
MMDLMSCLRTGRPVNRNKKVSDAVVEVTKSLEGGGLDDMTAQDIQLLEKEKNDEAILVVMISEIHDNSGNGED